MISRVFVANFATTTTATTVSYPASIIRSNHINFCTRRFFFVSSTSLSSVPTNTYIRRMSSSSSSSSSAPTPITLGIAGGTGAVRTLHLYSPKKEGRDSSQFYYCHWLVAFSFCSVVPPPLMMRHTQNSSSFYFFSSSTSLLCTGKGMNTNPNQSKILLLFFSL